MISDYSWSLEQSPGWPTISVFLPNIVQILLVVTRRKDKIIKKSFNNEEVVAISLCEIMF